MYESTVRKETYKLIPIIGICLIIVARFFSYKYEVKTNDMLLETFDFTGMTTIFLNLITVLNIIILAFDLYLACKKEEDGFPYKFNKIFAITFIALSVISIFSFILVRNEEEKIAIQFAEENPVLNNKVIQIDNSNKDLLKIMEAQQDEFSSVKMRIVSEVESMNTFERYIKLIIFKYEEVYEDETGNMRTPTDEESYYSIFSRFAILDLLLSIAFATHIKDEQIEKKTKVLE